MKNQFAVISPNGFIALVSESEAINTPQFASVVLLSESDSEMVKSGLKLRPITPYFYDNGEVITLEERIKRKRNLTNN